MPRVFFFLLIALLFILPSDLRATIDFLDSARHYESQADYHAAELFYKDWLDQQANKVNPTTIEALLEMASNQRLQNNLSSALENYMKAKSLASEHNYPVLFVRSSIDLADFFRVIEDYKESLKTFNQITLNAQNSDSLQVCRYYHRKAALYNEAFDIDSALVFSKKALEIANRYQLVNSKATIYNELANIYSKKGDFDKAIEVYKQSCQIWGEKNLRHYSNAYFNMGSIYYMKGDADSCIYHMNHILNKIDSHNWPNVKRPIYYYLSKSYLQQGDTIKSYLAGVKEQQEALKATKALASRELINMQGKYLLKEKNKELEIKNLQLGREKLVKSFLRATLVAAFVFLLTLIIFLINASQKNKKLKQLVNEKRFLTDEANHRIKNNLQLIAALIHIEMNKTDEVENSQLQSIATKIDAISALHQLLYVNKDIETIDLRKYMKKIESIFNIYFNQKDVKVDLQVDALFLKIKVAMYLGLLVTELYVNSLKHGFFNTANNKIFLSIESNDKKLTLCYWDNGIGIPIEVELSLIKSLCAQLKTSYTVQQEDGYNKLVIPIKL